MDYADSNRILQSILRALASFFATFPPIALLTLDIEKNVTVPTPIESENPSTPLVGGSLMKEESAKLTLTGANTYTGTTIIVARESWQQHQQMSRS